MTWVWCGWRTWTLFMCRCSEFTCVLCSWSTIILFYVQAEVSLFLTRTTIDMKFWRKLFKNSLTFLPKIDGRCFWWIFFVVYISREIVNLVALLLSTKISFGGGIADLQVTTLQKYAVHLYCCRHQRMYRTRVVLLWVVEMDTGFESGPGMTFLSGYTLTWFQCKSRNWLGSGVLRTSSYRGWCCTGHLTPHTKNKVISARTWRSSKRRSPHQNQVMVCPYKQTKDTYDRSQLTRGYVDSHTNTKSILNTPKT